MLREKQTVLYDGNIEELHEKLVRALVKHCGGYMMPLRIDDVPDDARFDPYNAERNQAFIDHNRKETQSARRLYDKIADNVISELMGHPKSRK